MKIDLQVNNHMILIRLSVAFNDCHFMRLWKTKGIFPFLLLLFCLKILYAWSKLL